MTWLAYTRGAVYPYDFSIALRAHFELSAKLIGASLVPVFYINIGKKTHFYWNNEGIRKLGRHMLKVCGDPRRRSAHFKNYEKLSKLSQESSEKIFAKDLRVISDKFLIGLLKNLYEKSAPAQAIMNVEIDVIDVVFEDFLRKKIKSELKSLLSPEEFEDLYKILSTPIYNTYTSNEQMEILQAAFKNDLSPATIDRIYIKYWWTSLGWDNVKIHDKEYFKKRIVKNIKRKNLEDKINEIILRNKKIRAERKKIVKEHGFSQEIEYWLDILDHLTKYHDLRKEVQMKAIHAGHLIMLEISRRTKVAPKDLVWLWNDEIETMLLMNKLDKEELDKRKKAISVYITKHKFEIKSGSKALDGHEIFIKKHIPKIDELKGFGASVGKAKGIVRICHGSREALRKIKKGDILVTGMTTPDYVPAMRKAAAIITDEGGITCHAAIISRELGIPCIVGTKNATSVLKDGDLVEVDAERGIIKKLN
jgi:phosphohistidine swiveling domain-containing protein